jgi:hypothetical protein
LNSDNYSPLAKGDRGIDGINSFVTSCPIAIGLSVFVAILRLRSG